MARGGPGGKIQPGDSSPSWLQPLPKSEALPEQLAGIGRAKVGRKKVFAKVLGFDQTTLAGWERGERKPMGKYLTLVTFTLVGNGNPSTSSLSSNLVEIATAAAASA